MFEKNEKTHKRWKYVVSNNKVHYFRYKNIYPGFLTVAKKDHAVNVLRYALENKVYGRQDWVIWHLKNKPFNIVSQSLVDANLIIEVKHMHIALEKSLEERIKKYRCIPIQSKLKASGSSELKLLISIGEFMPMIIGFLSGLSYDVIVYDNRTEFNFVNRIITVTKLSNDDIIFDVSSLEGEDKYKEIIMNELNTLKAFCIASAIW